MVRTMLTRMHDVIGRKNLKPSLLIMISPGRRPSGIFCSHGHNNPAATRIKPNMISFFDMFGLT